jgi:hypothetical protein
MRLFANSILRHLRASLPLVCLALLVGCATPKTLFTASGPDWIVHTGQALWCPGRGLPQIAGDLILAGDGHDRHLIQFDKTPISIVSAQVTSHRWLIQFPQAHHSLAGHGAGSTRFIWLYLPAALAGQPLPQPLRFERKPGANWHLENTKTGESVEGFLSP